MMEQRQHPGHRGRPDRYERIDGIVGGIVGHTAGLDGRLALNRIVFRIPFVGRVTLDTACLHFNPVRRLVPLDRSEDRIPAFAGTVGPGAGQGKSRHGQCGCGGNAGQDGAAGRFR
jgi:hypothetical protein